MTDYETQPGSIAVPGLSAKPIPDLVPGPAWFIDSQQVWPPSADSKWLTIDVPTLWWRGACAYSPNLDISGN